MLSRMNAMAFLFKYYPSQFKIGVDLRRDTQAGAVQILRQVVHKHLCLGEIRRLLSPTSGVLWSVMNHGLRGPGLGKMGSWRRKQAYLKAHAESRRSGPDPWEPSCLCMCDQVYNPSSNTSLIMGLRKQEAGPRGG